MTLLSIAQEILQQTKSATIPSTIIGNNQAIAVQILAVFKESITDLARSWDWQELTKEHSFDAVVSQNNYDLPSDFDEIINDTFWNETDYRKVTGSISAQKWRTLNNSSIGSASQEFYRFRSNQILIFPTPTATDGYIFEYVSKNIIESSGGSGQTEWLADTDVPVIDEYILKLNVKYNLLKVQSRPYAEAQRQANLALAERVGNNAGRQTIRHKSTRFEGGIPYYITATDSS